MKTNTIITIGRQYGSGGKEIGHFVAEAFGIKLYDKEMLARAAKESGICEELFETHDEKPTNSFIFDRISRFPTIFWNRNCDDSMGDICGLYGRL